MQLSVLICSVLCCSWHRSFILPELRGTSVHAFPIACGKPWSLTQGAATRAVIWFEYQSDQACLTYTLSLSLSHRTILSGVDEIASIPDLLLSWNLFTLSWNLFVLRGILFVAKRMLNFWRWSAIENLYVTQSDFFYFMLYTSCILFMKIFYCFMTYFWSWISSEKKVFHLKALTVFWNVQNKVLQPFSNAMPLKAWFISSKLC